MAIVYPVPSNTMAAVGNVPSQTLTIATNNTVSAAWNNNISSGATVSGKLISSGATVSGKLTLDGPDADIVINGVKFTDVLNSITNRLAILQPKPELLAKHANLRAAYEHYKTLEALMYENNNDQ